jgi:hypothetical protein
MSQKCLECDTYASFGKPGTKKFEYCKNIKKMV